jgi:hypothetical protein
MKLAAHCNFWSFPYLEQEHSGVATPTYFGRTLTLETHEISALRLNFAPRY